MGGIYRSPVASSRVEGRCFAGFACVECGAVALPDEDFFEERGLLGRAKVRCAECHGRHRRRDLWRLVAFAYVLTLVGGALALGRSSWAYAGGVAFLCGSTAIFGPLAIIPHELGHALMGVLVRFRVTGITVGMGPPVASLRVLGVPITLCRIPIGGATLGVPTGTRFLRIRHALFSLGGPLANLLLPAAVFLGTAAWLPTPSSLSAAEAKFLLLAGAAFGLTNLLVAISNLVPAVHRTPQGTLRSDGLQLLHALFPNISLPAARGGELLTDPLERFSERAKTEVGIDSAARTALSAELLTRLRQNRFQEAEGRARALRESGDTPALAALHAYLLTKLERHPEAIGCLSAALSRPELGPHGRILLLTNRIAVAALSGDVELVRRLAAEALADAPPSVARAFILDHLACLPIYHGRRELLADADAWSAEALTLLPRSVTLRGTRGSILVELGRWDEASALLSEIGPLCIAEHDVALTSFYLAKIAKHRGDRAAAERLAAAAERILPEEWLSTRIQNEIRSSD